MVTGIEAMRNLVYAFYDRTFSFRVMFEKYPELKTPVTNCLIGDLQRNYDDLWAKAREFARIPEPLPQGTPFVREARTV